jgi:hypothetical protein
MSVVCGVANCSRKNRDTSSNSGYKDPGSDASAVDIARERRVVAAAERAGVKTRVSVRPRAWFADVEGDAD